MFNIGDYVDTMTSANRTAYRRNALGCPAYGRSNFERDGDANAGSGSGVVKKASAKEKRDFFRGAKK